MNLTVGLYLQALDHSLDGTGASQTQIGTSGAGSSQLSSSVSSGNAISTGTLSATTTYTLTLTNAAGSSAIATTQVSVNQPFSATGPMNLARLGQMTTLLAVAPFSSLAARGRGSR